MSVTPTTCPSAPERRDELELVVVDVLVEAVQPGDDDRHVAGLPGAQHGADAGVRHDDVGGAHVGVDDVEGHERRRLLHARGRRVVPVLDDDVVVEAGQRIEEAGERLGVRPDRREDHRMLPTYFARRHEVAPGHWTKNAVASGIDDASR